MDSTDTKPAVAGVELSEATWRWIGIAGFVVSGVLFAVGSGISFRENRPIAYLDAHMAVAIASVLVGIGGLYGVQKRAFGRFGRLSSLTLVVGLLLATLGTGALYAAPRFAPLAFVGLPLTWLGGILMGAATYRGGVLPRWAGVGLAVAFPGAAVAGFSFNRFFGTPLAPSGAFSGAIVPGVVWFALAYALLTVEHESSSE